MRMMNYSQKVARGKYLCEAILYDGHFWQDIGGRQREREGRGESVGEVQREKRRRERGRVKGRKYLSWRKGRNGENHGGETRDEERSETERRRERKVKEEVVSVKQDGYDFGCERRKVRGRMRREK